MLMGSPMLTQSSPGKVPALKLPQARPSARLLRTAPALLLLEMPLALPTSLMLMLALAQQVPP